MKKHITDIDNFKYLPYIMLVTMVPLLFHFINIDLDYRLAIFIFIIVTVIDYGLSILVKITINKIKGKR